MGSQNTAVKRSIHYSIIYYCFPKCYTAGILKCKIPALISTCIPSKQLTLVHAFIQNNSLNTKAILVNTTQSLTLIKFTLIHSFIHSSKVFTECLQCARHYSNYSINVGHHHQHLSLKLSYWVEVAGKELGSQMIPNSNDIP